MSKAMPMPGKALLDPTNHVLIMIDHQSQMAFATHSIDAITLRNNAALVANAAKEFTVSTILTTVAEKTFSGPIFTEIRDTFPDLAMIDRTTMNSWEDGRITEAVNKSQKKKIVLCGLWTSVCIVGPALSAKDQGFEVYVIFDACGDVSQEAHECAKLRMLQFGIQPMTALQYMLELQRDWSRTQTYKNTTENAIKFGGSYGLGLIYSNTMFGAHEGG